MPFLVSFCHSYSKRAYNLSKLDVIALPILPLEQIKPFHIHRFTVAINR